MKNPYRDVARGKGEIPPPETEKIVVEKFFYRIFIEIFKLFSQIPNNWFFRPNPGKIKRMFVKFFEKYVKIVNFRNFLKEFFQMN